MSEVIEIEFTDRYGGNPPSWLRGCHDECEAMGFVPIESSDDEPEESEQYALLWNEAHFAEPHDCDGWHFVRCPSCAGTGRVSWLRTSARIPRWIIKGARFLPFALDATTYPTNSPKPWTFHRRLWLGVKCAWLYDLGWRR